MLLQAQAPGFRERNYEQTQFDSDSCCWRKLSQAKRYHEAALLIIDYIDHSPIIANKQSLNWHAGQMFAMANETKPATHYFKKTYTIFYKWFGGEDGRAWYYYARGNVAFVNRDKAALQKIINRWNKTLPPDLNFKMLNQMLNNWDKSYQEATM